MNRLQQFLLFIIVNFITVLGYAQQTSNLKTKDSVSYKVGKDYILGGLTVTGLDRFSEQTVKVHSGLVVNSKIKLPGDKLTSAIKRLYETKQFSKVDVYLTEIKGEEVYLEFNVQELPQLDKVVFKRIGKSRSKTFKEEAKLKSGNMVTENMLMTTKNFFEKKYRDKGFLNAKAKLNTVKSDKKNAVNLYVDIDKGKRVKIKDIVFHGNDKFTDAKLRKRMKKTKRKFFGRFWRRSKFVDEDYKTGLQKVIEAYSEKGYRDAIIKDKSVTKLDNSNIKLDIYLSEGKQYRFGNISFVGNTAYSDKELHNFLRLDKGDVYNSKILSDRVVGDGTPDSDDIQTLYLNNGYLFSRVTPVETKVRNDSIDVEVRIYEDEQATIRKVTVHGNDRTNDHVIYRELYTKPGNLFSKQAIIRSIRELSQLGFFDPEAISPNLNPNQVDKTVDIDYMLAEKGSSQIELQGGYGGRSFIGTLGLSFNNFSIKNIFNKKAYTPVPMGDAQSLSLRLQKSRFYSTYSFSFTEPWLGGKKPKSLSFSIYNSRQKGIDYTTYKVKKGQSLNIWGLSVGLGQRLKWPDSYFQLTQTVAYQRYELNNYRAIYSLSFANGNANNLSYNINLARRSSGPNPIFPMGGSDVSVGVKLTPPYSLLNGKDYNTLSDKEKYKWLEYYKVNFKSRWFTNVYKKLVLMTNTEFGFLGYYNKDLGYSPFEKYVLGGDGLGQGRFDGTETVGLRGYENGTITRLFKGGATVYNKFTLEARYPISLKPQASIYVLGFVEGGSAYQRFQEFNPFVLKRSAGLGVRIFMPQFGLLGIDFAHGFDPAMSIHGEKSGWQPHFVLGQQF